MTHSECLGKQTHIYSSNMKVASSNTMQNYKEKINKKQNNIPIDSESIPKLRAHKRDSFTSNYFKKRQNISMLLDI